MKSATLILPDGRTLNYRVRHSNRAKYMRMQFSSDKGLIVTQPAHVCEHVLADWINTKLDWISKASATVEEKARQREQSSPGIELQRPETLELKAINQRIRVTYLKTASVQIASDYTDDGVLTLSGATDNTPFCIHVLQKWTQSYAKYHLGLLLQQLAQETGFSYNDYRVKDQKTRWGSCSSRGNINLNYKLLLMPAEWARYTLLHELCHTEEMNHSKRFWALVEKHMPDYRRIHEAMKTAETQLPAWANHRL